MARDPRRAMTRAFSVAMMAIGIALIVVTIVHGGGAAASGILIGVLFVAAGAGRLYLLRR